MMKLKLLGILQDYDSPYVSLYIDDKNQKLYLAIEQESVKQKEFCTLLLNVSKLLIEEYLQNKIGLHEISLVVENKYLWFHTKDKNIKLVDVSNEDTSKYIDIDDDMFDSYFCNQETLIKYYLNN